MKQPGYQHAWLGLLVGLVALMSGCSLHAPVEARSRSPELGFVRDRVGMRRYIDPQEILPPPGESVFGILTTGEDGTPRFEPATRVPNIEHQAFGWFVWVGGPDEPVYWRESLTQPGKFNPDQVFDGTTISEDEHTATTHANTRLISGFAWNTRRVGSGDVPGDYELAVTVNGGDTRTFSFALAEPESVRPKSGDCPYMALYLNWWPSDPDMVDASRISEALLGGFSTELRMRGFYLVDDVEDTYWIAEAYGERNIEARWAAVGALRMQAFARFEGKPVRATFMSEHGQGMVGYVYYFQQPEANIDSFAVEVAEEFDKKLSPHARRMCEDWMNGELEREARLERNREELVREIQRVRAEREEQERWRRLRIDAEKPR